ncbi:MAG: peptidylprolyl isomerase [Myroides sp.]|nr:peptidylprolyl isomerase [Myroides sp.]
MKLFKRSLQLLLFTLSFQTFAQQSTDVLVTINDSIYQVADFERLYNKNIDIIVDESQKDVGNYFDLYTLYKLRLQNAYNLKLDKSDRINQDITKFRTELAEKYFINESTLNALVEEALERSKFEINASHILIAVDELAQPQDTLAAYNQALKIREEVLNGLSFEKAAEKYSNDLSAKSNKGNLGYFSVFRMVYPFETGAYNTKVGDISLPVRSNFGYHLIKVNNKRATPKPKNIAHILVETKDINDQQAKKEINDIYKRLELGDPFHDVAFHFSEDIMTRDNGGNLGMYNEGNLNIEGISDILYDLNFNGAYSKPFFSQYGWHIVAVTKVNDLPNQTDLKDLFLKRVKNDSRAILLEKDLIDYLKELYQFKIDQTHLAETVKMLHREEMMNQPKVDSNPDTEKVVATYSDKKITPKNILEHIYSFANQYTFLKTDELVINKALHNYSLRKLKEEYDSQLENKFPDFAHTLKEYKEGLMLFDLLEQQIWDKTATDTLALMQYYETHKEKYVQPDHFTGEVYVFKKRYDAKIYHKIIKGRYDVNEDDFPMVYKYQGRFTLDDKRLPPNLDIQTIGNKVIKHNNLFYVFFVRDKKFENIPDYKTIQSKISADYQTEYEKEYNQNLLQKANIKVNQPILDQLKAKYHKKSLN